MFKFSYSASSKSFFLQGTEIAALPEIVTFIVSKIIEYSRIQKYWVQIFLLLKTYYLLKSGFVKIGLDDIFKVT